MYGEQAPHFCPDNVIAFTGSTFQPGSLQYRNMATAVTDKAGMLQFSGGLGNALAAHAQRVGYQVLGHYHFTRRLLVKCGEEPPA